jgi:hypothetical protein
MPKPRNSRRIRKQRVDPVRKLGVAIGVPVEQLTNDSFKKCDVVNHSEDDHRAMVRAMGGADKLNEDARLTVRRLTRIELLQKAGVISAEQASACGWYAIQHEMAFHTVGCTANYGGAGGSGFGANDLLARYKAQSEARENYRYARQAIPDHLIGNFEAIVLGTGRPPHMMPKEDKLRFSLAAFLLHQQIGHMLAVAA